MRTNHLCVRINGEVDSLSPRVIFLPSASFVDLFYLYMYVPYCLFCVLQPCGHLLGNG